MRVSVGVEPAVGIVCEVMLSKRAANLDNLLKTWCGALCFFCDGGASSGAISISPRWC